jgi:PAS domain S-box-containing protein
MYQRHRPHHHSHSFLAGGGEMGALIRGYEWAATPLGPPERWPQGLKTAVRFLLSTGHPMFIWWGPDLIQFYNDAYRRSIGPERHPVALGQNGRECWAEIWDIIGPQIEQVMTGGGPTWHENQLVPITRHGMREDVYWTYSYGPIDEPGAPNGIGGVLVVCTETTEQVLAEQRLRAAEARWRGLFEQSPAFTCMVRGPQHIFEFANPAYYDLIGGRDIIGKTIREALPEVKDQGFIDLLDEVYQTGKPHVGSSTPVTFSGRSGGPRQLQRYVDFVYQPVRNAEGIIIGVFAIGSDVTDRVLASEELRAEGRRKDVFLAMLAHELRNPLAPIRNASELLARSTTCDSKTKAIGDLLQRQVVQLTRLVDDLLDVSRITQGRIELQRAPLELGRAVSIAVESVQPLLGERQCHVVDRAGKSSLYVEGDLARIVQCIANLLSNSIKFTEPHGRIEIVLARSDGVAIIEISDDGAGISAETLPKVFELFVQADQTLDRAQGGLGIGLAVVQRLVQMHGGRISAMSKGLGHGSTFRICLPLIEATRESSAQSESRKAAPKRVLIVDDNADAADSLAHLLHLNGHETLAVYGAQEALERASAFGADIVLLDIGLPGIDGYELARRLRAARSDQVLIAVTGYGQSEDIQSAREAGFNAHLTKPTPYADLERLIETTTHEVRIDDAQH